MSDVRDCLPPERHPRRPAIVLPAGSIDTHVHVFEPRYPLSPGRGYNPPTSTLADLKYLHATLGIERVVFTQPSVYGTDNSAILDAMAALNAEKPNRARSVVALSMEISESELAGLDAAGVRGVRLNTDNKGGMPIAFNGFLQRDFQGRESATFLDFIVLPFFKCGLLFRLQNSDQFRQHVVVDFLEFRRELRVVAAETTTSATAAPPLSAAALTANTALGTSGLSGGLRVETLDRILHLFECGLDDWLHCLFLIAGEIDLCLRKEFLHRVHRIGLLASSATEIASSKEGRGQTSATPFFLSKNGCRDETRRENPNQSFHLTAPRN